MRVQLPQRPAKEANMQIDKAMDIIDAEQPTSPLLLAARAVLSEYRDLDDFVRRMDVAIGALSDELDQHYSEYPLKDKSREASVGGQ
jgi:hypothetical protein